MGTEHLLVVKSFLVIGTTTRAPEPHRNLVDSVRNNLAGTTVSEYDYTNDAAGRRTDVVMTGTAFNQNTFNAYAYNDRKEVVGGQKYQGVDPNDTTNPVPSYDYDYNYDPIGNRQTFTFAGTIGSHLQFHRFGVRGQTLEFQTSHHAACLGRIATGRQGQWRRETFLDRVLPIMLAFTLRPSMSIRSGQDLLGEVR